MIDNAVNQLLREHAGVAENVRPSTTLTRLTDPMPRVVYTNLGGPRSYTDHGASNLIQGRYQVDAWASTATEAREVLDDVRKGLDGFRGTVDDTRIVRIYFPDTPRPGPPMPAGPGADVAVVRLIIDMNITYRD